MNLPQKVIEEAEKKWFKLTQEAVKNSNNHQQAASMPFCYLAALELAKHLIETFYIPQPEEIKIETQQQNTPPAATDGIPEIFSAIPLSQKEEETKNALTKHEKSDSETKVHHGSSFILIPNRPNWGKDIKYVSHVNRLETKKSIVSWAQMICKTKPKGAIAYIIIQINWTFDDILEAFSILKEHEIIVKALIPTGENDLNYILSNYGIQTFLCTNPNDVNKILRREADDDDPSLNSTTNLSLPKTVVDVALKTLNKNSENGKATKKTFFNETYRPNDSSESSKFFDKLSSKKFKDGTTYNFNDSENLDKEFTKNDDKENVKNAFLQKNK